MSANAIYLAAVWPIPVIIAITFHEAANGFVAYLLGDDTAWRLGRISFNPLKHVVPFGTILLPGVLRLLRSPLYSAMPSRCPSIFALSLATTRYGAGRGSGTGHEHRTRFAAALAFHIVGYLPVTTPP